MPATHTNREMWSFIKSVMKTIFFKLYMNFIGAVYMFKENTYQRPRQLPDYGQLEGRTVVVTGGGRGIGEEAVKKFLRAGLKVICGVRSPESVQAKFEKLRNEDKEGFTGTLICLHLDLMRLESVRSFADAVLNLDTPIHVLANNAGIMFGDRKVTEDGYESQMSTNYLGHFLLTHLLMPALAKTAADPMAGGARVVNVSSCAHYFGSWLDWSDWSTLTRFYSPEQAYGNSKVAQVLSTQHLARMIEAQGQGVKVYSIHPGIVYTDLYVNVWWMKPMSLLARAVMKTPEQGGDTLVHAVMDPDLATRGTGLHLENHRPVGVSSFAGRRENQEKMWADTCRLLGIQNFGQP